LQAADVLVVLSAEPEGEHEKLEKPAGRIGKSAATAT
jgi:hypothetical protein